MGHHGYPIKYMWDGVAMAPIRGYQARCDRQFVVGEVYTLEVHEERSSRQHRHYFASINEAFQNVSDDAQEKLKTPEHLRKWALIETGWYDEKVTDCGSQEIAIRMATFTKTLDSYCEIRVAGSLMKVRTAKSQSVKSMGKDDFQKSTRDVLDLLSDMIGVNRTVLERYGRTPSA